MTIIDEALRLRQQIQAEDDVSVSIGLFGQPGAGKSSLINALIGQDLSAVSVRNDTTTGREEYKWNGLTLVDLPGYDTKRFPADKYVSQFGILDFDLLLCVFDGKFHAADTTLFHDIMSRGKVALFVRTKHDALYQPDKSVAELEDDVTANVAEQIGSAHKVFFTSSRNRHGLDQLERAIRDKLEPAKRDRWLRATKAHTDEYLSEKKVLCERRVVMAAGLALASGAASAFVPIPGANLAVDVPVLMNLFQFLRETYGLTNFNTIHLRATPMMAPAVNSVVRYATTDGILLLLAQFASKQTAQNLAKFIPFVGSAIAGTVGFGIVYQAGHSYLAVCHQVAESILHRELDA